MQTGECFPCLLVCCYHLEYFPFKEIGQCCLDPVMCVYVRPGQELEKVADWEEGLYPGLQHIALHLQTLDDQVNYAEQECVVEIRHLQWVSADFAQLQGHRYGTITLLHKEKLVED